MSPRANADVITGEGLVRTARISAEEQKTKKRPFVEALVRAITHYQKGAA